LKGDIVAAEGVLQEKKKSIFALEASNFFLADVQTGLGPFLAAYLASSGWNPARVGFALTIGGVVTVLLQTPAGAAVDKVRSKRAILVIGVLVLAAGALLLASGTSAGLVYPAQFLIGAAAPFLGPTLAAITMGLVGKELFDRQFGKNQAFNSAGNVACALGIAAVSHFFGNRGIFLLAAVLVLPTILSVLNISSDDIDYDKARGCDESEAEQKGNGGIGKLLSDKTLVIFMICAFLFHFANAAMLPQLGELLSHGSPQKAATFMSACVIVTQFVIMCGAAVVGRLANQHGRKTLLLIGFGVLPVRAVLYTLTHWTPALIGIQLLDGVANAIFGVVSILVVADLTRGTGRFNFAQGALATAVGLGAALSPSFGGKLIQVFDFRISFLALAGAALCAFFLLLFAFPETLHGNQKRSC
jgi:MFS family permease